MATFGQGINANLGAIDYSAYQRGAAQGAQSIGQGLAGLGQGIGVVVKERKEYKNNVASAKKLIAGLNTLNIPEEVKTQMGALGAQIDDPNISLSEQSAIATRLSSLADGIVGAGLKQSFEDAKNKRISDAVKSIYTTQTPEQSIESFNNTLAGKPQKAFVPKIDESKLGNLLSVMPADQAASYINALSNREKVLAGDPRTPYLIAKDIAQTKAANRSNQPSAGSATPGEAMKDFDSAFYEPVAANGAFFAMPKKYAANGTTGTFDIPGIGKRKLTWVNGDLIDESSGLLAYNKADLTGEFKPTSVNPAFFEFATGKKPAVIEIPTGKIDPNRVKLKIGNSGGLFAR
jgi:hypothetical protein